MNKILFSLLLCFYAIVIEQCCSKNDLKCVCGDSYPYSPKYISGYVAPSSYNLPFNKIKKDGNFAFSMLHPMDVTGKDMYTTGNYTSNHYTNLYKDNKSPICGPGGSGFIAITDTIFNITFISNKDYDSQHPAGKPLNDIMTIEYSDLKDYVMNGYPKEGEQVKHNSKLLKNFNEDSLANYLIGASINIKFDKPSLSDSQTFTMIYKGREGGITRVIKKIFE